eukprot:277604_1
MANNNNNENSRKRTAKEANLDDICELDLELKEFECPRCNASFDDRKKLFAHMWSEYSNPTICHICNKNLNALPNVLSHSYIHKQIKPYKCITKNCKYESRTRFNLKVHLASCAGIEKFKCRKRNRKQKVKTNIRQNANNSEKFKYSNKIEININPTVINDFDVFNTIPTMDILHTIPNNDILNEIQNSGAIPNDNRDNTFLIVIHKDYIPPRSNPHSISQSSHLLFDPLFQQPKQEYMHYDQYFDDTHHYTQTTAQIPPIIGFDQDTIAPIPPMIDFDQEYIV